MLKDKVILVTGASGGIGKAAAVLAAKNRAKVVINYRTDGKEEDVFSQVKEFSPDSITIKADVSNGEEVKSMFSQIKKTYGRLDVLFNNAGILRNGLVTMTSQNDIDLIVDTNIKGAYGCMQRAAKMMIRQNCGKIINNASIVGRFGDRGLSIYSASKGAVIAMTKAAAKDLGDFGITVNAIAPGIIDTDMTRKLDPQVKENLVKNTALNRIGTPLDVANVVIFLSSNLSDYVSGQIIGIDGCQIL